VSESPFSKAAFQQLADLLTPEMPESFQDYRQQIAGRSEALASLGTAFAGSIPAGLGGLGELIRTGDPSQAADLTRQIQESLTYIPRTERGQEYLQELGAPLGMAAAPSEFLGESALGVTDSPLAATVTEIAADPVDLLFPGYKTLMSTAPLIAKASKARVTDVADGVTSAAKEKQEALPKLTEQKQEIILSSPERGAIRKSVPRTQIKPVQEQVSAQKASYPEDAGWAQDKMVVSGVKKKKNGFEVQYKTVPYGFDKPPIGVDSAQWEKIMSDRTVDSIEDLADRVKQGDPSAKAILEQANWYRSMRTRLREEFGGLGDVFADVLGATSAQTGVEMNWNNAIEIMRRYSRGEFDDEISMYEDMLEQGDVSPVKLTQMHKDPKSPFKLITNAAGSLFNANSPAATKALLDMFRVAEGSPKTPNFTGNLIGYTNAPTVDVWAARYLRRLAGKDRLPPPVEQGVTGKHLKGSTLEDPIVGQEFGFGQRVLTDAAKRINDQGIISSVDPSLASMNPDD